MNNIPIISFFVISGKRSNCSRNTRLRYFAIELAAGLMAVLSWAAFFEPIGFLKGLLAPGATLSFHIGSAALYFAVLACLISIALIDHDTMEIPDSLNIAIAVCGLISIFIGPDIGLKSHLIGIAVAAAPLFVIFLLVESSFGFGDVKLMAAAGFFLGWQLCLVALFIGVILGGVYATIMLLLKRKGPKDHFAFGPALCAGIGTAMFIGNGLIELYFSVF